MVDARTNTLFVQDTPSRLEEVRTPDRARSTSPVRQVMIEARIVEANDTFSRNLGVRLGLLDADARQPASPAAAHRAQRRVTVGGELREHGVQTGQSLGARAAPVITGLAQRRTCPRPA